MMTHIPVGLAVVLALLASPALAQSAKPNYDRLKSMLEEKFDPRDGKETAAGAGEREPAGGSAPDRAVKSTGGESAPRSLAAPPARALAPKEKQDQFEYVKPDIQARDRKRSRGKSGETGSWIDNLMGTVKEKVWGKGPSSSLSPLSTPAAAAGLTGLGAGPAEIGRAHV